MSSSTQQVKERSSPSEYILLTIQQASKDACVKRTGLLVGFGGKEDQMVGLSIDGSLNFHDILVYAITKIEWNFGRKNKIKFFEPDDKNPQVDNHVKNEAWKLAKKLFGTVTTKLGLEADGYFNADRLYKNPPKHTSEEITEPVLDKIEKKADKADPPPTYPDGGVNKAVGSSIMGGGVRTYVPEKTKTTSYTTPATKTTTYTKDKPMMFRRSSTELVKARVAAIAARLEELALLVATAESEEKVVQLKDQVKQAKEEQVETNYSLFCLDCKKRDDCIGDVARVHYCSNKVPEND